MLVAASKMRMFLTSPASRNWQTRWTQNPVAARPCGFEPLRRQCSSLSVGRSILDVGGSMFAGVTSIVWVRFPPPAVFIEHWAFRILHVRPSMTRSFSIQLARLVHTCELVFLCFLNHCRLGLLGWLFVSLPLGLGHQQFKAW